MTTDNAAGQRGSTMNRYTVTFDDAYSVLRGPDGFECVLGEPEDRTWTRDGADVVARLEEMEDEIDRLRGLLREAQGALGNLVNLHGHASVVLRKHPAPCNGLDFCVMRDADVIKGHIDSYFNPAPESQVGGAVTVSNAEGPQTKRNSAERSTTSTSQACPECGMEMDPVAPQSCDHGESCSRFRKCGHVGCHCELAGSCHGTGRSGGSSR